MSTRFSPSEAEIQQVIAALRAGASVQSPGSRCHSSLQLGPDGWLWEHFDEGAISHSPGSEDDLRRIAVEHPEWLLPLLQAPHWQAFRAAFWSGQGETARQHLQEWLRYGDRFDAGRILLAVLDWPARAPDDAALASIRQRLDDRTLWHLFMDTVAWQQNADSGQRGLAFADTLAAMLGEAVPGLDAFRDTVRAFCLA